MLPKDPNDDKNVIVEIRAGAGGDEAALFRGRDLPYVCALCGEQTLEGRNDLKCEEIGIGGMKKVNFMITGQGAYSVMKYESGVHRVQRVPETESGGRIHTSTITCRSDAGSRRSRCGDRGRRISVSTLCVLPETVVSVSIQPILQYD